jgi:hypothetical protein
LGNQAGWGVVFFHGIELLWNFSGAQDYFEESLDAVSPVCDGEKMGRGF